MNEDKTVVALDALKAIAKVVEDIREAGATVMETMITRKVPINKEIMALAMLLQSSLSFSVAIDQWLEVCENQDAKIFNKERDEN